MVQHTAEVKRGLLEELGKKATEALASLAGVPLLDNCTS